MLELELLSVDHKVARVVMVVGTKFIFVPILILLILLQLWWPAKQEGKWKRELVGKGRTKIHPNLL
jgi:uncharacterized paraquat-inducible protein A